MSKISVMLWVFFHILQKSRESVVTILSKVDVFRGIKKTNLSSLANCMNWKEGKTWKEFSYSWRRVWQSFYIKIITHELLWPSSGLPCWRASRRLPSPCWGEEKTFYFPPTKDLIFISQLRYLSSKWLFLYMLNNLLCVEFVNIRGFYKAIITRSYMWQFVL